MMIGTLFQFFRPYPISSLDEDQILNQANRRILQIQRGNYTIDLGAAMAGQSIQIIQRTDQFQFGSNAYQYGQWGSPAS